MWLVWRRQRVALLFAIGLAALVALVTGLGRFVAIEVGRDLGVLPCLRGVRTAVCNTPTWTGYYSNVAGFATLTHVVMLVLPTVCGIIAGAGLFARDMERGTHVFALSQSTSRLRWWSTGLLVAGLPVAVAVAATSVIATLALRPFGALAGNSPLDASTFLTTGVLPVAYALLAFGLAATSGLVLRNALAAVAVAAVLQLVVLGGLGFGARTDYLPAEAAIAPVETTRDPAASWPETPANTTELSSGFRDAQGNEVDLFRSGATRCFEESSVGSCLRSVGVTDIVVRYQPESRYWPFQAIEGGIVLALLAGSLGVGLWGLRRRVH